MQIICMRHGHADAGSGSDAERPLSHRGRGEVLEVAQLLHAAGIALDAVVASPLLRTQQTAELVALTFALPVPVGTEPTLSYAESPTRAAGALQGFDARCLLAVGHMPTLPQTVALLGAGQVGGLVTAEAVCVEDGRLRWRVAPGDSGLRSR